MQFMVKIINPTDIKTELYKIGFDESYIESASLKHEFLNIKIENLKPHQAEIIKQTALSKGCDAAIHRDVLLHKIEFSSLILSGTKKQLLNIANSLLIQPFSLKEVGTEILRLTNGVHRKTPLIAGILNITDNSFSDGGKYLDKKAAIEHAKKMIDEGADIIDIGAEATNPKAEPVTIKTEIERLTGIISKIKMYKNIPVSIDTRNAATAKKMIDEGADIINDISGLNYDPDMINVIKNSNAEIIIMHSRGIPSTMDNLCNYENLSDEIYLELYKKIKLLNESGVENKRIIIDVGFGFAKNIEQNFELLEKTSEFNSLGVRQMVGVSRKRFLKSLLNSGEIEELDNITMLASFYLIEQGVDIIRVHNVKKTKLALEFFNSLHLQKPCP